MGLKFVIGSTFTLPLVTVIFTSAYSTRYVRHEVAQISTEDSSKVISSLVWGFIPQPSFPAFQVYTHWPTAANQ